MRSGLTFTQAADESIVYDEAGGQVHVLNATASSLLERIEHGSTLEELVAGLVSEHDLTREQARSDLCSWLDEMDRLGLLDRRPDEPGSE